MSRTPRRRKAKSKVARPPITSIKLFIYDEDHFEETTKYLTDKFGNDWRYVKNTINDADIRNGKRTHVTAIIDSVIDTKVANEVRDTIRKTQRLSIAFRDEAHFYHVTKWLNQHHGRSKMYWTINLPNVSRLRQGKPISRTVQLYGYEDDIEELRLFLMLG